jgi:hypothetical protein
LFGAPALIARQFNAAAGAAAMRRATIAGFLTGATVVMAFLLAAISQPRSADPAPPAMQVSFFVGVLAFQVAVTAGACAASRAAATWRRAAACGHDRAFVRRCAIVSMLALFGGVLAVTTNMALDAYQAAHANVMPLAVGAAAMIAAVTAGLLVAIRLDVNTTDNDSQAAGADTPDLLLAGESAIAFVHHHPVLCCLAATGAATTWAMTQTDASSITAALPWGISEAVTVITAFVLLGPTLGLRRPPQTAAQPWVARRLSRG